MKRVFSVPPTQESKELHADAADPTPPVATPARPRPSVYVREVSDRHRSAIYRIFAQVRQHLSDAEKQDQTPPGDA